MSFRFLPCLWPALALCSFLVFPMCWFSCYAYSPLHHPHSHLCTLYTTLSHSLTLKYSYRLFKYECELCFASDQASLVAQLVKNLPAMWETWVQSLAWEDTLDKGKATHSSTLENSMDCTVHGVAKSWTGLSDFHSDRLTLEVFGIQWCILFNVIC